MHDNVTSYRYTQEVRSSEDMPVLMYAGLRQILVDSWQLRWDF
jgi:hypothetical protein